MTEKFHPDQFWLVAGSLDKTTRENMYENLKNRSQKGQLTVDCGIFDVPLNLKYDSFDDLIRLVDDLTKQDIFVENGLRRMERQVLDIDAAAEFKIIHQRSTMPAQQFLSRFQWDDARYPRNRPMRDNLDVLVGAVARLDEEVRSKAASFNEIKQQYATTAKKDSSSLAQQDLTSLLTPEVVQSGDFVETEHLTTAVLVVPKQQEGTFLESYEKWNENVCPRSAKRFTEIKTADKDNELWRVILFRKGVDDFRTKARSFKVVVRDFTYDETAFSAAAEKRTEIEMEKGKQEAFLLRVCLAAFSDIFIAWVHLKAMRVFVEAVLRFGLPPRFAAFILKPASPGKATKLLKELESILMTCSSHPGGNFAAEGEEEYYPFAYVSLLPFTQYVQK